MADTRRDRRAPVALKVRYKSATVDEFMEHYSEDISRGGTFIKSKKPMSVGTLLKFELQLQDESRLIHGVGRVVWTREPEQAGEDRPPGMGIKFIKMDPDSRALVQKILDTRGDRPGQFDTEGDGGGAAAGAAAAGAAAAGAGAAAEAGGSNGQGFFPSTTPEDELPDPEDRTAVRHASEFLAEALADTDEASANEARAGAEAARKRTEEIERARAQDAAAEPSEGGVEDRVTDPSPASEELVRPAGEGAAAEGAEAPPEAGAPSEPEPETAAAPAREEPAAEPAAAAAGAAAAGAADRPAKTVEATRPKEREQRSKALPVAVALVAVGLIVYLALSNFGVFAGTTGEELAEEGDVTAEEVEPVEEPPAEKLPAAAEAVPEEPEPELPTVNVPVRVKGGPKEGVVVSVDGEPVGTDLDEAPLPVGKEVTVTADAEGYVAASEQVTATEGDNPRIALTLEEMPYMLMVETVPPGVHIRAGGGKVTTPGRVRLRRKRDPVNVVAVKTGFKPIREEVPLSAFQENEAAGEMEATLELELEPRARRARRRRPAKQTADQGAAEEGQATEEPGDEAAQEEQAGGAASGDESGDEGGAQAAEEPADEPAEKPAEEPPPASSGDEDGAGASGG